MAARPAAIDGGWPVSGMVVDFLQAGKKFYFTRVTVLSSDPLNASTSEGINNSRADKKAKLYR
jgi:hypothetical protein